MLMSGAIRVLRLLGTFICLGLGLSVAGGAHGAELGYYQWPTLSGQQLVFASEGDLWRASLDGGPAIRLTTHVEEETHPMFSPDGQTLAFVARYESTSDIYLMPAAGGRPRRVTFEGGGVVPVGWFDNQRLMYVSSNAFAPSGRHLKRLDTKTGAIETLPLANANAATRASDDLAGRRYSDPGEVFFSRYGLSLSRDNAVHYRGGRMAQLWRWSEPKAQTKNSQIPEATRLLPNFAAPIRSPMWWQGRVYFVSDASGADNIWSIDAIPDARGTKSGDARQHTQMTSGQILSPQMDRGRIVYQQGADLFLWEVGESAPTQIALEIVSDREQTRVRTLQEPLNYLEASRIAADGKSVAITARGQVVQAYPGSRRRVDYHLPDGARGRGGVVADSGLFVIVDVNTYSEIWQFAADGTGAGKALVDDVKSHVWSLHLSPDGKRLVFDDKLGRLWLVEIASGRMRQISKNVAADDHAFSDFTWSPAGRYLAFTQYDAKDRARVHLYDTQTKVDEIISSAKYEAGSPGFSHNGEWLYFATDRHFKATPSSPWGDRNLGTEFDKRGRLFALQLAKGAAFPFAAASEFASPADDEASQKGQKGQKEKKSKNKKPKKGKDAEDQSPVDAVVDFAGLKDRVWPLPVAPDNVAGLAVGEEFLYVLAEVGDKYTLRSLKMDAVQAGGQADAKELATDVTGFGLSNDRKTLFVQTGKKDSLLMLLVPAAAELPKETADHSVRIADWQITIEPRSEWAQQLRDVWRMHRDFAYDTKLRGLNWDQIRRDAEALLPRVGSRFELNSLIKQMVAPLGILHSQIRAGDVPKDEETAAPGYLGAQLVASKAGVEIGLIYQGERDLPETLGPLLQPGVEAQAGDLIAAIDGRKIDSLADVARALAGKAGQQVRLDLRRGRTSLSALAIPANRSANRRLRYGHWVHSNAAKVETATDGALGYLHLEAMGGRDVASFARDFYAQLDKDGIIIDVRGNRGGNIDSWILNALMREVWAFWESPAGGKPFGNMQQAYRGHLVVLINEATYSDGETFAAGVKALGITDLIGTQTAGAGIWLTGRNSLSDKGMARIAELPQFGLDGRWLIEGRGVSPDIPVATMPVAEFLGDDAQLSAAINYLNTKRRVSPVAPLQSRPLPEVGTAAEDVERAER